MVKHGHFLLLQLVDHQMGQPQPNGLGGFDMGNMSNMMNPMMYNNLQGMLGGDGNMNMMQNQMIG